jgi:hypothetical protein
MDLLGGGGRGAVGGADGGRRCGLSHHAIQGGRENIPGRTRPKITNKNRKANFIKKKLKKQTNQM